MDPFGIDPALLPETKPASKWAATLCVGWQNAAQTVGYGPYGAYLYTLVKGIQVTGISIRPSSAKPWHAGPAPPVLRSTVSPLSRT